MDIIHIYSQEIISAGVENRLIGQTARQKVIFSLIKCFVNLLIKISIVLGSAITVIWKQRDEIEVLFEKGESIDSIQLK